MAVDITAAGTAGAHTLAKTNVHLVDNFIYYKTGAATIPASVIEGSPWIFRNSTGSLTGITNNTLVYAKIPDATKLQFSTSSGGSAIDLTDLTSGNITLNSPYVYNNILNIPGTYADQQAVKYYTNSTPLTGLVSGNTYYLKTTGDGLALPALYSFTTATFTNASTAGRIAPTLATLQTAYSSASYTWASSYLTQGDYQGYQDWTVPQTGIYEFTVSGAKGGEGSNGVAAGTGARVKGRVSLTRGEIITIAVGQIGTATGDTNWPGAGGGSFVVRKAGNVPLFIAGGGAGDRPGTGPINGVTTNSGATGTAGYPGGINGNGGSTGNSSGGGGGFFSSGATATAGNGGGGAGFQAGLVGGTPPSNSGEGGFGGGGSGDGAANGSSGGGGGYSGGGGGNGNTSQTGGGGSYIIPSATNVATSDGNYNGSSKL